MSGLSSHDSLGIGVVSNSKGVMGLVIASIALDKGLIDHQLFSVLVIMDVATTIVAPIFLTIWRNVEKVELGLLRASPCSDLIKKSTT